MRDEMACWALLGITEPSLERRREILEEFKADSDAGRARRSAWRKAIEQRQHEHDAIGGEMNQRYSSTCIYLKDETKGPPKYENDAVLYYQKSTYPGSRLPHAWLNKATPTKPLSTHDIAGKGTFAILTGIGGREAWNNAADKVSKKLNVDIRVSSIGWRQDYEDSYFQWDSVKGVDNHGAVLVRPDRFVAWRCQNRGGATPEKLGLVMKAVLGWGF